MRVLKKYFVLIFLLNSLDVFCQSGEFFINHYFRKDYSAGNTNYGIVQNKEGLIFAANMSGVIVYDGFNWKLHKVPNEPIVSGISISEKTDDVFIGCDNGDFGIFSRDKKGSYKFFSLRENLPGKFRPSLPFKYVQALNNKAYFLSEEVLIEYHQGELKTFFPVNKFHIRPMVMNKDIFVEDLDNNLLVLSNGVLKPVLKSEEISSSKFYFCYKIKENEFAVGFRGVGMYKAIYDPSRPELTRLEPLPDAPCNDELQKAEIVNGFPLRNGNFVVTSNKAGAFILDKGLRILHRLNNKTGVYDENIKAGFEDINGNIWLALNYGISFIEIQTPIRKFTKKNGINGVVQSSAIYKGVIHIATDKGVFYFDSLQYIFKQLNDFSDQTWDISVNNGKMYISTSKALYTYDGKTIQPFYETEHGSMYCLLSDPGKPEVLYCGHDLGVDIISSKDASIIKSYLFDTKVRSMVSDKKGNVFFGCETNGIYFINADKSNTLDSLKLADGLPSLDENYLFDHEQELLVAAENGIYRIQKNAEGKFTCVKHPQLFDA
ncbi:MAG: hypothetical protein K0S12_808, partial [Bacteroidetes bacterium]|nr:hypothetical protein [Bacteroidota bacterium]